MKKYTRKELLSIPNLMGYFRLLMIPVFVYLYLHAETDRGYYAAAAVMGISSITDMFDGLVARKFNMITEFGKFLDPFADKMTHGALYGSSGGTLCRQGGIHGGYGPGEAERGQEA